MPGCDDSILEDIEDIVAKGGVSSFERTSARSKVVAKHVKREKKEISDNKVNNENSSKEMEFSSVVPGTQKIWVKTWGCAHNNSDSEYMAGQLAAYGYKITDAKKDADLWLLNSCTVKTPAEDHFKNEIEYGRNCGIPVVVAGCVPQGQPKAGFLEGLSIIGVQQIDRVVEVVEEALKGHSVRLLGSKKDGGKKHGGASLLLPKVRKNPLIEIIPINTGCLNQCTYCKTKHARGELGSYHPEEIVTRMKQSFQEGVCEVWLTSEDTGAYGRDIGITLPDLLYQLVDIIPTGCMLRLGMTNPPYILESLEAMADILNHPRVYAFLHVPVQSGSDAVLSDMKREYSVAEFERVVEFLRERVPGISIATDIICGFPTESEEDFTRTMELCKKYRFPSLFINQFFPRPGTPASRLPRLPTQTAKNRTKRLSEFFKSYQPYDEQIGQRQTILVTELSHDRQYYVGHNKQYVQVLVPKDPKYMGKMVEVIITSSNKYSLFGEPVANPKQPDVPEPLKQGQVSGLQYLQQGSSTISRIWPFLAVSSIVFFRIGWILWWKKK